MTYIVLVDGPAHLQVQVSGHQGGPGGFCHHHAGRYTGIPCIITHQRFLNWYLLTLYTVKKSTSPLKNNQLLATFAIFYFNI